MNYFEDHIGDYAAATSHLSWDEDMAYTRLIRLYYHHEKPIPADVKIACRMARATTTSQRKAVEAVLHEFFSLAADGWHQKRCDAELQRYWDKQAKAKRSADARWSAQRSQSDGNATAHANASPDAMRTHSEGNAPRHQTQAPEPIPDPKPESALSQEARSGSEGTPLRAPDSTETGKPQRHGQLAKLLRDLGVQVQAFNPLLIEWADELQVSDDEARAAVEQARFSKPEGQIPAKYLDRILRDLRTNPKANGKHADRWWDSEAGIQRKGAEHGLTPGLGESWASFRARVNAAVDQTKRSAA